MVVPDRNQLSENKYPYGYYSNFNPFEPESTVKVIHSNRINYCSFHEYIINPKIYSSSFLIVNLRKLKPKTPLKRSFKNLIVTLK